MRCHLTPVRMIANQKNQERTNVGKVMERRGYWYSIAGSVNWYSIYGKSMELI